MDPAKFRSVVPADQATAEAARRGGSIDDVMVGLLPAAVAFADASISNFPVGSVAEGTSGALYLGANLEFAGQPLGASVHAEQAAIVNAWEHGEAGVIALAVTAAPCGHCRQFLNELTTAPRLRVLTRDAEPVALAALLPAAFGPQDLGLAGDFMHASPRRLALDAVISASRPAGEGLARAALRAAEGSYAPYSGTPAGIALALRGGATQTGRYLENAAFNPSLPPLQSALVRLALRGVSREAIVEAVLVEAAGPISQRTTTEALLRAVAPDAPLHYCRAVPDGH